MAGKKKTPKKTTGVTTTAKRVGRIEDRVDALHGRFDRLSTLVISQFTATNGEINDLRETIDDKFTSTDGDINDLRKTIDDKFDGHNEFHTKQDKRIKWYGIFFAFALVVGVVMNNPEFIINLFKMVVLRLF